MNREAISNAINHQVFKGMCSGRKKYPLFRSNILISRDMYEYLRRRFALDFKFKESEEFLRDMSIMRAHFKTLTNVTKCVKFTVAIRYLFQSKTSI
jgi:hypothetical protein